MSRRMNLEATVRQFLGCYQFGHFWGGEFCQSLKGQEECINILVDMAKQIDGAAILDAEDVARGFTSSSDSIDIANSIRKLLR